MEEIVMKKFSLVAFGLALGMTAPAMAADLRVKAPPPAPVVAPVYNWTGFYIGANGGWGQVENCWDFQLVAGPFFTDGCHDRSGGLFGGQIGYRWQTGGFVFGLEAQGDWADLTSTRTSLLNPAFSTRASTDAIGLFTGQIGWAWDAALLYVKGGAAVTKSDFSILTTVGEVELASVSSTRWGATIGAGFEYGFAPNWSVGIEYNHLFMGDSDHSFVVPALAVAASRIEQDVDMVTLRLNYRFGWGSPVAPRY
jgi:outer membrane immunogenic protein